MGMCAYMWRIVVILMVAAAPQLPSITIVGDGDAVGLLQLSREDVALLRSRGVLATNVETPPVPELFYRFPIPQSVAANAKARAELRAQGLHERDIGIGDSVGAFAVGDSGYWFGKSVYNAEGESGRGGIGFLSKDGNYTMLDTPTLRTSSVSALLVESEAIWAGIFYRGEQGDTARGLLRYDRKTNRARTFAVPAIIHTILRVDKRLFIGTHQGPYMLKNDTLTRLVWK